MVGDRYTIYQKLLNYGFINHKEKLQKEVFEDSHSLLTEESMHENREKILTKTSLVQSQIRMSQIIS